jgi:hypothetical protein
MKDALPFRWTGAAFVPLARAVKRCAAEFVAGKIYQLKEDEQRSEESHSHYFACIKAAFDNLPEKFADRFSSPEHLRKWCLIRAGYRNEHTIILSSEREAQGIATLAGLLDEFAVVMTDERIVTVWVAKSQQRKRPDGEGMSKDEFEASKEAVLRECSKLLGIDVVTLLEQVPRRQKYAA